MFKIFIKRIILFAALAASLILNVVLVSRQISSAQGNAAFPETAAVQDDPSDWDTFILALAWVESKWNPEAVGESNDVGYLQITPILVADANRIAGRDAYSLSDRTSVEKSVEIFNVIQDRYNPAHDKNFSLKIWNPRAPVAYHRRVMAKYNELRAENTSEL